MALGLEQMSTRAASVACRTLGSGCSTEVKRTLVGVGTPPRQQPRANSHDD
jgi:hypothetical protein